MWFWFCSQMVPMSEAKLLLNEDDYLLKSVYDYWMRKRKIRPSLIPRIKQERRDGSTNGDAYVAFRRRMEKMQTRKVSEAGDHGSAAGGRHSVVVPTCVFVLSYLLREICGV